MVKINTIYLDADGTIADWVRGVITAGGLDYKQAMKEWPPGEYSTAEALKITPAQLRQSVARLRERFWRELPVYRGARAFYAALCCVAPVYFCTDPTWNDYSAAGKIWWLKEFTRNSWMENYILTPHKHLLSREGVVLIDDNPLLCAKFENGPGRAILVPRIWNCLGDMGNKTYPYVLEELHALRNG